MLSGPPCKVFRLLKTIRQLEAGKKKNNNELVTITFFQESVHQLTASALTHCWAGSALCVTEEIGWRRRSVCFQYDPWRENSLWADITPNCDSRGQTGEATHTSQPSPDTCPAPVDLSHVHTQTPHIHVSAYSHTWRSLKPQAIYTR